VFPNLDLARGVVSRVGAELRMAAQPTPEGIVEVARDADGLLVTYAKITADMIGQMKRCRIISRFGIGVDNVDIDAATASGIVVTKVPDYCIDEVSDHAMACCCRWSGRFRFQARACMPEDGRCRRWCRSTAAWHSSGAGGIRQDPAARGAEGKIVRVARGDVRSLCAATVMDHAGVERVEFDELVRMSDYISIHTPLMRRRTICLTRKYFVK